MDIPVSVIKDKEQILVPSDLGLADAVRQPSSPTKRYNALLAFMDQTSPYSFSS